MMAWKLTVYPVDVSVGPAVGQELNDVHENKVVCSPAKRHVDETDSEMLQYVLPS